MSYYTRIKFKAPTRGQTTVLTGIVYEFKIGVEEETEVADSLIASSIPKIQASSIPKILDACTKFNRKFASNSPRSSSIPRYADVSKV